MCSQKTLGACKTVSSSVSLRVRPVSGSGFGFVWGLGLFSTRRVVQVQGLGLFRLSALVGSGLKITSVEAV